MNDNRVPASGPEETRFYQRPWFQGTGAVLTLLAAVWAFGGFPKPWTVISDLFSSELPVRNAEIVFDASAKMQSPMRPGQTRLEAAANAVDVYGTPLENQGLAFRRVGGSGCQPGPQLVDFGADHSDDVVNAAKDSSAGGRSNLAATVAAAIDDFANFPPKAPKQVVIFAGTTDDCQSNADQVIKNSIKESHINATFELIGVRLNQADQARLRRLQQLLGGKNVDVVFASTNTELQDAASGAAENILPPTSGTGTVGGAVGD